MSAGRNQVHIHTHTCQHISLSLDLKQTRTFRDFDGDNVTATLRRIPMAVLMWLCGANYFVWCSSSRSVSMKISLGRLSSCMPYARAFTIECSHLISLGTSSLGKLLNIPRVKADVPEAASVATWTFLWAYSHRSFVSLNYYFTIRLDVLEGSGFSFTLRFSVSLRVFIFCSISLYVSPHPYVSFSFPLLFDSESFCSVLTDWPMSSAYPLTCGSFLVPALTVLAL